VPCHLSQSCKYLAGVEIPEKTMELGVGFFFSPVFHQVYNLYGFILRSLFPKTQEIGPERWELNA
jgi:hypothetical protein